MAEEQEALLPPRILCGDPGSFAQYTLAERFPHIIRGVIGQNVLSDDAVQRLEALDAQIRAGTITPLQQGAAEESEVWAGCVAPYLDRHWEEVPFLFAEMYFYRRILEAVGEPIDPFATTKQRALQGAGEVALHCARLLDVHLQHGGCTAAALSAFAMETLWSNRADLSQIGVITAERKADAVLVNELAEFTARFAAGRKLARVDYLLDNAGDELLADLAFVCYLLEAGCVETLYLHAKRTPLFVSDATRRDVDETIVHLGSHGDEGVREWGVRLSSLMAAGRLVLRDEMWWHLPVDLRRRKGEVEALFAASELVIFKGDTNYRRAVDDRYWPHHTPLAQAMGYFPAPALLLRVLKSEVLLGLEAEREEGLPEGWLTNGKFGVIQYYPNL